MPERSGREVGSPGDKVIIISYCLIDDDKARNWKPKIVLMDEKNKIKEVLSDPNS